MLTVIARSVSDVAISHPRHRKTERFCRPCHREAYRAVAVSRQGCRGDCHSDKPPRKDKKVARHREAYRAVAVKVKRCLWGKIIVEKVDFG